MSGIGDGVYVATPELACAHVSGEIPAYQNYVYSYTINVTANYDLNNGWGGCTGTATTQFGQVSNVEIIPRCICQTGPDLSTHTNFFQMRFSDFRDGKCGGAALLTLTPAPNQKDPRPLKAEGKDGKSTFELMAKVMEGGTPKAGVAVTFAVEVAANSGGHDHHDASRPKGKVTANSPVTDANGEIKVTFQASQISGTHVVAAVCSSCTNTSVTKNVDVKVPDLVPFLVLPLAGMQWNPNGVGGTPQHTDNHYLTLAATYKMLEIASKFKKLWPAAPQLTLNDGSLEWGGKFDIDGTWETNPRRHAEHRLGDNVDVRANTRPGAVPSDIRKVVFRWLRDENTAEDKIPTDLTIRSVNPLHEGIGEANEHFHLRLGN